MRCGFRSHSQRRERRARPSGCIDGRRCAGERTRTHARRARARRSHHQEQSRLGVRLGSELEKVASRRKDGQARHAGRDPLEGGAGDAGHPGHRGERPSGSRRAPDERQEGGGEREVASHLPRPRLGVNNRPRRGGPNGNASPVGRPRRLRRLRRRLGVGSLDVSDPPAHPAIHPSRPRELSLDVPASPRAREDGTRSTPGTPPSHRKTRLIPAPDLAAETSGASDLDAHTPAHVTEMHISQFAESLRALRDLGISGIRDLDGSFREASEEQESEQMRVLLEERSRARRWCESSSAIRRCRRSSFE